MENPEECSVCYIIFDESERRPRTLSCGHSFCSPCIADLIEDDQLCCPSCRTPHPATSVLQFHINYSIEALVKKLKATKLAQTSTVQGAIGGRPPMLTTEDRGVTDAAAGLACQQSVGISGRLWSLLDEQKSIGSNLVTEGQEVQSQLDQYRAQLADWKTQHFNFLDQLNSLVEQNKVVLDLLNQEDTKTLTMKQEREEEDKELEAVMGCLDAVNTTQEFDRAFVHADDCNVKVKAWIQKCQEIFPDIKTVSTSRKVHETISMAMKTVIEETDAAEAHVQLEDMTFSIMEEVKEIMTQVTRLHFEDLLRMAPPVKRLVEANRVFAVQKELEPLRSSKITLENGQLYLHCLEDQPPPPNARILPVSEVVGALDLDSTLAFLELAWPGSAGGRVYIRLSPDTPLARHFVLLCTGQRGHSYRNTVFLEVKKKNTLGEYVVGGDYQYNNGTGGKSLLPHLQHNYRCSVREGEVSLEKMEVGAQFAISTRESIGRGSVFGQVEKGLEVVRAAVNHINIKEVTIVDCGVVVPL